MNMPGFTAESSLYNLKKSYRLAGAHSGTAGQVVPQLPTSRACTACDGFFWGSHVCCDIEIVSCTSKFQNCVVNFKNCQTESCGLLVAIGGSLGSIF
jgi:hypothetical protein